jgi:hypothetical protein
MRSNIISAFHHLRMAKEHFQDLQREMPDTLGSRMGKKYEGKIDWIYQDFITIPLFPNEVREGIRNEWKSDVFAVPAINEKVTLLDPEFREMLESVIAENLAGEDILLLDKIDK